jgi:tRNA uridine 5-carboxymethylaminomethyl modification enzyme
MANCFGKTPNVDFWQDTVTSLLVKGNTIAGVKTSIGVEIEADSVVLTNGTFLNGVIHIGEKKFGGGRSGEKAATGLTEQLITLGFDSGRMKTGTPPRVDGRSLNYSLMEEQWGDEERGRFSYTDVECQRPALLLDNLYQHQSTRNIKGRLRAFADVYREN